jgi:hypothetical protein
VSRPYTPIACRQTEFDCIIKIYEDGEMTQHLNSLQVGASLKVRGVSSDVTYKPGLNSLDVSGFANDIAIK